MVDAVQHGVCTALKVMLHLPLYRHERTRRDDDLYFEKGASSIRSAVKCLPFITQPMSSLHYIALFSPPLHSLHQSQAIHVHFHKARNSDCTADRLRQLIGYPGFIRSPCRHSSEGVCRFFVGVLQSRSSLCRKAAHFSLYVSMNLISMQS